MQDFLINGTGGTIVAGVALWLVWMRRQMK
jgi:hypothetical protein